MIIFTIISYTMPIMRGRPHGNSAKAQALELKAFWMMNIGMVGLTLSLATAGVVQILDQRVGTELLGFMESQATIAGVYTVRAIFGLLVFAGLITYFASFFVKEDQENAA
jgi:nitric oxide reductase subunit B